MTSKDRIESVLIVLLGMLGMTAWYNMWVVPRDKILNDIMDCMGSDHSQQAYNICATELRDK